MKSDSLKVWIINQYAVTPEIGGLTRHHAMSKYLPEYNIQPTVISGIPSRIDSVGATKSPPPGLRSEQGVQFFWIATIPHVKNGVKRIVGMVKFSFDVIVVLGSRSKRQIEKPDLIIGSSPHLFAALAAWILAKRFRVPFILEVRDLWPKSLVKLLKVSPSHPFVKILGVIERLLYRRADRIAGLLEGVPAHVRASTGRSGGVFWLPNGADLEDFPKVEPIQEREDFLVVYAGAHGVPNALTVALDAAQILSREKTYRGGKFIFTFIGEGAEKEKLVRQAEEMRLEEVRFLPRMSRNDVFPHLFHADALLITALDSDLYEDGVSLNKSFDYLAAGKPILMGLKTPYDIVAASQSGVSFSPEDAHALVGAIREIDQMPLAERKDMGLRGRQYVWDHHRYSRLAQRLASEIYSVLAEKGSPRV